jgi:hypothetical protein
VLARELGYPQRQPCVRDGRRPVVLESCGREALSERVALADGDAIAPVEFREGDPLRRILGVQVEREPDDLGVELAPCPLGRLLAEPAERSDVVAPDDDRML